MVKILNDLLSKLPFNGKKSVVGVILSIIGYAFPDFPLNEGTVLAAVEAFQKLSEYAGPIYLAIGLLHKWIKTKV